MRLVVSSPASGQRRGAGVQAARSAVPAGIVLPSVPVDVPELDVTRVQRWCAARVPGRARHQVRVECEIAPRHLTVVERRAPWRADVGPEWTSFPIARLRYTAATTSWTLLWRNRNQRFHAYEPLPPSPNVGDLLAELDRDPTGIFWG